MLWFRAPLPFGPLQVQVVVGTCAMSNAWVGAEREELSASLLERHTGKQAKSPCFRQNVICLGLGLATGAIFSVCVAWPWLPWQNSRVQVGLATLAEARGETRSIVNRLKGIRPLTAHFNAHSTGRISILAWTRFGGMLLSLHRCLQRQEPTKQCCVHALQLTVCLMQTVWRDSRKYWSALR